MISCTEFLPAYSTLFSYIDDNFGGHDAVVCLWAELFKPDGKGLPLIEFAKKDGLRGCWNYWKGTLTEEAADVDRYMNEKEGWIYGEMHHCPSKGRLLKLQEEIGFEPYYDYCGHCDHYRASLEVVGLTWMRNHLHTDKASCCSILYDPKVFKGVISPGKDVETLSVRPEEHEYYHPAFHNSLNRCTRYIATVYGVEHLKKYLVRYTESVYVKTIEKGQTDPLGALEEKIRDTYEKEKAPDALTIENNGTTLSVKIAYCPAVRFLRSIGREVNPYFGYTTETVMETLAKKLGIDFEMEEYEPESGKAAFRFRLKETAR